LNQASSHSGSPPGLVLRIGWFIRGSIPQSADNRLKVMRMGATPQRFAAATLAQQCATWMQLCEKAQAFLPLLTGGFLPRALTFQQSKGTEQGLLRDFFLAFACVYSNSQFSSHRKENT
jgi:hypothetical protein